MTGAQFMLSAVTGVAFGQNIQNHVKPALFYHCSADQFDFCTVVSWEGEEEAFGNMKKEYIPYQSRHIHWHAPRS